MINRMDPRRLEVASLLLNAAEMRRVVLPLIMPHKEH